jgi:hypothetical protein
MSEEDVQDRVQTIFTSVIKSAVVQLSERFCSEEYPMDNHMEGCAMTLIKEASQIALIMSINREEFLATCGEIHDIVFLLSSDHEGSA